MLSQKYKCIFVHIPKVAGQSIEHAFLDLHDLSWDERAPLLLRQNKDPKAGPPRLAHLKASEYVSCGHITQELFDSYFKFSFVRNPWSRVVSMYKYLDYSKKMPFKKFVFGNLINNEGRVKQWFVTSQYEYVFNDRDELIVDYVGRFEDLQKGFEHVCDQLGIEQSTLPYVNHTLPDETLMRFVKTFVKFVSPFHRKYDSFSHYSEYYDSETRDLIAEFYAKDIDAFGYTFNE